MSALLGVVIVIHDHARWLPGCLTTLGEHAGDAELDVVVVDNESSDGGAELVEREYPWAKVVRAANRGFAWGCNRGLEAVDAPLVLFLNPDTEIRDGKLGELCDWLGQHPQVGLVGARQVDPRGRTELTIRRFPSPWRMLGEAVAGERLPLGVGERERDPAAYERAHECDWVAGSFMLARREAIRAVGGLDERFFMYSEETDLCLRLRQAGWRVAYAPLVTVLHAEGHGRGSPRMEAQGAWSRLLYARKHFGAARRVAYRVTLTLKYGLRAPFHAWARPALLVALGVRRAPFAALEREHT